MLKVSSLLLFSPFVPVVTRCKTRHERRREKKEAEDERVEEEESRSSEMELTTAEEKYAGNIFITFPW